LDWVVDQHALHGDVFSASIGGARTVLCGGAAGTGAFFRAERRSLEVYNTPLVHDLFGRSVFNLPPDEHSAARRLVQGGLTVSALRGHAKTVAAIALEYADSWRAGVDDLYGAARQLTMEVCGQVIVGLPPGGPQYGAFAREFETFVRGTESRPGLRHVSPAYWQARSARSRLRRRFDGHPETATESPTPSVVAAIARHGAGRPCLADLPDHVLALLIAARETTASLLTWLLVEFALDAELTESVTHEAERLVAEPDDVFTAGAAPILRAALLETERLHSPNALSVRTVLADLDIGGFRLPGGWRAAYSPAANHLMADLYPEPRSFRPDRFLNASTPAELLTFGRGLHRCPGRHLAEMVVLLVAAAVCSQSSIVLTHGRPERIRYLPVKAPTSALPANLATRARP
jgi:cytochrome P450